MSEKSRTGSRLAVGALGVMLVAVPLAYLPLPFVFTEPIFEYSLLPKRLVLHVCVTLALLGWLVHSGWGRNLRLVSSPLVLPLV